MIHETLARLVDAFDAAPGPGGPAAAGPFEPLTATLSFVLGLVVGTAALAVSAGLFRDDDSVGTALVTALLGALVAGLVGWLIAPVLVGVVLAVLAWLAVIRFQYGGDWTDAAAVGAGAWLLSVVIAALLGVVGLDVTVVGVPMV